LLSILGAIAIAYMYPVRIAICSKLPDKLIKLKIILDIIKDLFVGDLTISISFADAR